VLKKYSCIKIKGDSVSKKERILLGFALIAFLFIGIEK
jgi:hypothetical protein